MTKPLKHPREIETLSLLAHKVAANVFDLSSSQVNVSIRDQMVRAQQLVIDLKAAHPNAQSILVVGMGAAGMTAALAACNAKFETVCGVDVASKPFALFNKITSRFVGPYMYEWPSPFCDDQSYPAHGATPWGAHKAPLLTWKAPGPLTAHDLAHKLRQSVADWYAANIASAEPVSTPHLLVGFDKKDIRDFVKKFAKVEGQRGTKVKPAPDKVKLDWYIKKAKPWKGIPTTLPPASFAPDYVILAAGMGTEVLHIPGAWQRRLSPRFWANDSLKDPGVAGQTTVVLGGGDGAIQDSLRALTMYDHPLQFINDLDSDPGRKKALASQLSALLSADRQLRQHTSWSRDTAGFVMADEACRVAAKALSAVPAVKQFVLSTLRPGTGTVTHYVRSPHFDKAYLLNRFVIRLLAACVDPDPRKNGGGMGFSLHFGLEVKKVRSTTKSRKRGAPWTLALGPPSGSPKQVSVQNEGVDHVVVRFGIDPETVPGPTMIQFDEEYASDRTTLNRVELPFVTMNQ